jgi:hypothetical protein
MDASSNGNTGVLVNTPLWVAGLAGHNALQFPGSLAPGAAYVYITNSATLPDQTLGSQITICAWVKRSAASVGTYCSVVAKDVLVDSPPYHRNYELIFDTAGHILFVFRNSAGTSWELYSSSAVFNDTDNWHFYCVTYTYGASSSCTLYVDGAAVAGSWISGNGSDPPASTSGGPVLIGIDGAGTASNGSIYDEISIYNVMLSASQILALFNSDISAGVASATTLASSQNPAVAGSTVTLTATVGGSGGTPTGTVVFYDGSYSLGTGTLDNSGTASLGTAALSVIGSPHSITAVYGGDGTYAGSTSGVLTQIITGNGMAVSIPLVNPSFETPAGAPGAVAGAPDGWVASIKEPFGVFNPTPGIYTNEVNDILPPPADGSQVLFIQGENYLAQFLTNTLAPNQTYTLSGAIGNRADDYGLLGSDNDYVILLAGGTIIAENPNLPHPAPGCFLAWAISYTTGSSGFPSGTLEIRLGQNGAGQVNYDNISLTSMSVSNTTQIAQEGPEITVQPANQTVQAGSSPTFTVAATGSGPLDYLWYFGGANMIQSSTNSALTLSTVFTNNAGDYTVVVTNTAGSVTSAVATLTVTIPTTPPRIVAGDPGFGFLSNRFGFDLAASFGQTIVVDGTADFLNWTPVFTNVAGSNTFYFCDPASTNLPWRFYRARLQ